MNLFDKMKKAGTINIASELSSSMFFVSKDMTKTDLPILNIAFSGDVCGGLTTGITVLAGQSKSFKTLLGLYCMKAYMDRYPESVVLFYDNEFGTPPAYFQSMGIDITRVIHIPITNIDELKFDLSNRLKDIERNDKVFIFVDSVGNLPSKREADNALAENQAKDMSRAQDIKSLFRVITPHITMKDIPCVIINHVYQEMGLYPKTIVSGGCLVKDTKVIMSSGILCPIQEIEVGDMVKTRMGDRRVTHVWNAENLEDPKPECLKITFDDDLQIICSKTHKFMDVEEKWIEAKDITKNTVLRGPDNSVIRIREVKSAGKKEVFDIAVEEAEHYYLANGVVSHNSGVMLSANQVFVITKSQEKVGQDIVGYNFNITVEKSRFVREKSKVSFLVTYEGGVSKYSGLLEIALETGHVQKPSNGWYVRVNKETGEVDEKKVRAKDTFSAEFWEPILESPSFQKAVEDKYKLCSHSMFDPSNPPVFDDPSVDEEE